VVCSELIVSTDWALAGTAAKARTMAEAARITLFFSTAFSSHI
jgi:hypothetical protein